jgi:hypothetical protein
MTINVKHNKTNAIADWTQADLDAQIALGNFPAGTLLANIVLPSDWNNDHTVTGLATVAETGAYSDLTGKPTLGTISSQDANNVAITGGTINGTSIGATTASTGKFTTLEAQTEILKGTGQNLLTYSEQFNDAAWGKESCSITSNTSVAPNGTTTADTLTRSGTGNSRIVQASSINTSCIVSIYAKAGTQNFLSVQINTNSNSAASFINFDLTSGAIGASTALLGTLPLVGSTENVGNGWYRCSVSFTAITDIVVRIGAASANNSRNGIDGGTIFIWGAQLEIGTVVSTYVPTTATTIYGAPSLSFSGVATIDLDVLGNLRESSASTNAIRFYTNNLAQEQMRVSHTASAVNYLQVTGAATTSFPIISAQGSDANISLQIYSKGTGGVNFWTSNGGSRQFQVAHTAGTVVNFATATGNVAGAAPTFSVAGTDTNIDLALTPKGTGLVRFGTYVAGALLATGYINIKAADGTTYKVLVST